VGGRGCEIFALATRSLQLDKTSAATLSQQDEYDSADVQRGRANISGFLGTIVSYPSRRYTFGEFELLAIALLRALHH
jgi:hypothetical protein